MKVLVLTRFYEGSEDAEDVGIHGVYASRNGLEARLEAIRQANPQYPLVKIADNFWSIGPEEDEGFFGNHKVYLRCIEANYYEG
jgi:hypothetical protein